MFSESAVNGYSEFQIERNFSLTLFSCFYSPVIFFSRKFLSLKADQFLKLIFLGSFPFLEASASKPFSFSAAANVISEQGVAAAVSVFLGVETRAGTGLFFRIHASSGYSVGLGALLELLKVLVLANRALVNLTFL